MTPERVVEEYAEKGYRFALSLCGGADEARELLQEAFVKVLTRWDSYDPSQPLDNWFYAIVRHLYLDGLRRYERRHGLSLDAAVDEEGTPLAERLADRRETPLLEGLERREAAEAVQRALASLKPEYRAILTLVDVEGMGYEGVAAALEWPMGTVRSRLFRAREALRKALTAQEVGS